MESPNTESLATWWEQLGADDPALVRAFRNFNAYAPAFKEASDARDA
jgi:hypothetical protein